MQLNKSSPRLAILRAQLAAERLDILEQRAEYIISMEHPRCRPAPKPDANALPLPPSYWDDLEHWLKTLAPAKPAATGDAYVSAKQPAPAASGWLKGADVPPYERVGLWHYKTSIGGDIGTASQGSSFGFDCEGEYRPAAPGTKYGDPYDESKYATAEPTARLASTSGADGAALVGAGGETGLRHLVCVVAGSFNPVGTVLAYGSTAAALGDKAIFRSGSDFRLCDKDGFIPHTPTADSVCPVPTGVHFETLLWVGSTGLRPARHVDGGYGGTGDCNCIKWDAGTSVIAWRPIAKAAS